MGWKTWVLIGVLTTWLSACAKLPTDYPRTASTALEDPRGTTSDNLFLAVTEAHPGQSGFVLLPSGETAFTARDDMIAIADKTIDAQYFDWSGEPTGRLLLDRLIRAADRGVRVRILIDDVQTGGKDLGLAHLNNLPNVEVRVFNPFANRGSKAFGFLTDFSRVNRRMHNKALIVDNTLGVIGGRNIGDHYFGVDTVFNYRDLDLLSVGPVVRDISAVFDDFWNSDYAVPIDVLVKNLPGLDETRARQQELYEWAEAGGDDYPYPVLRAREETIQSLAAARDGMIWTDQVELLFDPPEKVAGENNSQFESRGNLLTKQIERELLIETPYFVPEEGLVATYRGLEERGIDVRVLTNSLTSIDVVPAFAGYSIYREPLLRAGVDLHELKADIEVSRTYWSLIALSSKATVHTKALVADRRWVFVGSFNADPRSRYLNTEAGLLIYDEDLAAEVADFILSGMSPEDSYKLILNDEGGPGENLTWVETTEGEEIRHKDEPEAPFWLIFASWFLSLLPIESQL